MAMGRRSWADAGVEMSVETIWKRWEIMFVYNNVIDCNLIKAFSIELYIYKAKHDNIIYVHNGIEGKKS